VIRIASLSLIALAVWTVWATTPAGSDSSGGATRKTAKKKKKKVVVRRAPVVSAAVRSAALVEVKETVDAPETFDDGAALVPFFERLFRMKEEPSSVHVLHYGDSHTASDDLPNALRVLFQERFGDGGPGFSMPGRPFLGYRRYDVKSNCSLHWYTEGTPLRLGDGLHGMGGVSLTATRAGEYATVSTRGDDAELLFLQQPGGGSFDLYMDGILEGDFSTDGPLGPASLVLPATPPAEGHTYLIRTRNSAPVRLLGTVVQNRTGVTWETMGINGAQVSMINRLDMSVMGAEVAKRDPAMIVLAFGTNEANSPRWDGPAYGESLRQVIQRFRQIAPLATILLIGPPDSRIKAQAALAEVVEVQRAIAIEMHCAFWDWRARMGGPGAVKTWVTAGVGQGDYIHLTSTGYQLVGKALFKDLMGQYERFLKVRNASEHAGGQ
jgi:lysophospholipase L1-like esterase